MKTNYYPHNGKKLDWTVEQATPHNDVVVCCECGLKQQKTINLHAHRTSFWGCNTCQTIQRYAPSNSVEND